MLYIAIGIIGATVMPHNLYLHSALVQSRRMGRDEDSIRRATISTPSTRGALTVASGESNPHRVPCGGSALTQNANKIVRHNGRADDCRWRCKACPRGGNSARSANADFAKASRVTGRTKISMK